MHTKLKFSLIALSTIALTACGSQSQETQQSESTQESQQSSESESSSESSTQETVSVEDNAGNTVEVNQNPSNLAIFDYGQIDNLDALGLGDQIAVTASTTIPEYLEEYSELPVAGTLHEPDLEATNAADAELAVISGRSRDSYDSLSQFVPTLNMARQDGQSNLELVENSLNAYASLYGVQDEADAIVEDLQGQLEELQQQTADSDQTALFVMFNEGSLSAYGPGSRFGVVHDEFGFTPVDENIEASSHGMNISYEYLLETDPDIIFMLDRSAAIATDESEVTSSFYDNPIIEETTAYQNDNIVELTPDAWYLAQGGAQAYEQMIEEASQALE